MIQGSPTNGHGFHQHFHVWIAFCAKDAAVSHKMADASQLFESSQALASGAHHDNVSRDQGLKKGGQRQ